MPEFVHPMLGEDVTSISGHYALTHERTLRYAGKEVLYFVGYAVCDTSCCGSGGVGGRAQCEQGLGPDFLLEVIVGGSKERLGEAPCDHEALHTRLNDVRLPAKLARGGLGCAGSGKEYSALHPFLKFQDIVLDHAPSRPGSLHKADIDAFSSASLRARGLEGGRRAGA